MGKFKIDNASPAAPKRQKTGSKAIDVKIGPAWCRPSDSVVAKLGEGSDWLFGVDIETNDWQESKGIKGEFGQFRHYHLCAPIDFQARVVQLGWAFGPPGNGATIVKERLVRPDGFTVSDKATRYHKISHEQAEREGSPLHDVLSEFAADLFKIVDEQGGRLVCHHLTFDAGILFNEMGRCAMTETAEKFVKIVRAGLCTMDPQDTA